METPKTDHENIRDANTKIRIAKSSVSDNISYPGGVLQLSPDRGIQLVF